MNDLKITRDSLENFAQFKTAGHEIINIQENNNTITLSTRAKNSSWCSRMVTRFLRWWHKEAHPAEQVAARLIPIFEKNLSLIVQNCFQSTVYSKLLLLKNNPNISPGTKRKLETFCNETLPSYAIARPIPLDERVKSKASIPPPVSPCVSPVIPLEGNRKLLEAEIKVRQAETQREEARKKAAQLVENTTTKVNREYASQLARAEHELKESADAELIVFTADLEQSQKQQQQQQGQNASVNQINAQLQRQQRENQEKARKEVESAQKEVDQAKSQFDLATRRAEEEVNRNKMAANDAEKKEEAARIEREKAMLDRIAAEKELKEANTLVEEIRAAARKTIADNKSKAEEIRRRAEKEAAAIEQEKKAIEASLSA